MEILKFTKKRGSWYELLLENNDKLLIHEDLILKYDLLLNRKIGKNKDKILDENNNYIAYDRAVKYLSNRTRSKFEIKNYLLKQNMDEEKIDFTIQKLVDQGYLNDEVYAKLYVKDRINLSNDGPSKIISNLKSHNINEEYITNAMQEFDEDLQKERIKKLIEKQVKTNSNKGINLLKQKILLNLINLGYSRRLIVELLDNVQFDDSDLYEREYQKVKEKLSKKYSGKELELRIRQKLYQKGFRI